MFDRARAFQVARREITQRMWWEGFSGGNHVFRLEDGSRAEVDLVLEEVVHHPLCDFGGCEAPATHRLVHERETRRVCERCATHPHYACLRAGYALDCTP